ncbi:accessory gene regulator ArgB-like protein [Clostridium kluyveri]|uniref:Accessory regulator AgrB n=1 Tax=Clostridium kluyveri TaxID=1534 RepID=A0A1L5FCD7_CLOKL|nr:accessory gene regulator B family protein [Clostridium kluyveri]APM40637.1 accessory regulator AgrB [Clostridium kluyveri]UZQ49241.1 accessory gene regulator B family protein [Clostridium kluyveri]
MNKLISCVVSKISETNPQFSDLELKKIAYGLECILDEITKIIPYFIIFWIFSLHKYYLVILIFFCPIRLFTGGYHAKTYWGCFFITFIIFTAIILMGKYILINNIILIVLLIISFIFVWIFAPVDNINKRIKSEQWRRKVKHISMIITFCLSVFCYFLPQPFLNTAVISITFSVALMVLGKIIDLKIS